MRKVRAFIVLGAVLMFLGLAVRVLGIPGYISMEEFANANEPENRTRIAEKVLVSTGRSDMFKPEEAGSVRVNYAELTKKGVRDALVTVDFGPEATIMAVYTPTENGYEYVGEVGYFYDVDNINFFRPDPYMLDIISFRESNNQSIGALERSSFIRGYAYYDGQFRNVINIDENIEAWWNDQNSGITDNPVWNKITQTSVIENSPDDTVIDATKTQIYSIAPPTENKMKPEDAVFQKQAERVINEIYTWNNEWQSYIVDEKTENATGEKVAILKDFAASPYVLTGDNFDRYRILRKNGSMDLVNHSDVSDIQ